MKRVCAVLLCIVAVVFAFIATLQFTKAKEDAVYIKVEDFGVIRLELYEDVAPITVKNFRSLINKKFYDGLTFHRVIEDFMIQGGCPNGNGTGDAGYEIKGEFSDNGIKNDLKHERGVISMARGNAMDSASCQFFIVHETSPHLDGQYAAFGRVTAGMKVVDKIAAVPTNYYNDKPLETVKMETVTTDVSEAYPARLPLMITFAALTALSVAGAALLFVLAAKDDAKIAAARAAQKRQGKRK